jgi:hypothetical protein
MFKNNTFSFSYEDWRYGMKPSRYAGVPDMRNIDPFSNKGALLCGQKPTAITDGLLADLPHLAFDEENNKVYIGLESGRLLSSNPDGTFISSISTSANDCSSLAIWKNHVIYAGDTVVEVYDIDGTFFYNNWESFNEGARGVLSLPHHVLVGRDDVVYITDGVNIASLQQASSGTPFDPNTPSTYTWNATALDLPDGYVASSLSEYGTYLIIGSYFNASLNRGNKADIFPWDRTSPSYNNPIRNKGNGVWQSIENNGRLFALYDTEAQKIVQTNLSAYAVIEELRLTEGTKRMTPDSIEIIDDEIMFGIGTRSSSVSGCGIYGNKEVDDGYFTHLRNTLSPGDQGVEIGSVVATGEGNFMASWAYNDGTTETYGIDLFDGNVTDDYSSYIVSAMTNLATAGSPKQFKTINISLGRKLQSGHGVRVSYRKTQDDTFTVLKTFDFDTYGDESSLTAKIIGMSPVSTLEVKVELKGSGTTSPEFVSLSLT